ncbi:uncharacterized protein EI90DRAFT_1839597 [Cantharellus anzutake]|uniref:uncharacterized protein n=1 Tax=Cantharellus anzutake TaxID=1750568 RepID=UPI001904DE37|nr:uncharacterized protein EI90DRAFT_1839597 [Cantharellus anzutake]KAF8327286.1 hypothetical protein EI90DRAFT_1839597 [Cantharellus anzutake]
MLRTYLRWCEEQGIKIDPRLSVRVPSDGQSLSTSNAPGTDETQRDARSVLAAETGNVPDMDETEQGAHGLCVFATAFIENREIVASIPKSAVLSARNFRYSRGLEEFLCEREVDPNLSLSLALCIERCVCCCLGSFSLYLQTKFFSLCSRSDNWDRLLSGGVHTKSPQRSSRSRCLLAFRCQ